MNEIKYAWRPATEADIGSVARFSSENSLSWWYGILLAVSQVRLDQYHGLGHFGTKWFYLCEIQYIVDGSEQDARNAC